ncbi:MAG: acetolactate synthase small subunit [Janthinobacterium lividum]
MTSHTLSVLVQNVPGVLARVAGLVSRRGFNIESLAVGSTESPEISRITLSVDVDELVLEQMTKQLNKLIEVLKIVELEPSAVHRELILIKIGADLDHRGRVLELLQLFQGAKAVDISPETITIEAVGSPEKLAALMQLLEPFGIRELVQSGVVAMGRGPRSITDRGGRAERHKSIRLVP